MVADGIDAAWNVVLVEKWLRNMSEGVGAVTYYLLLSHGGPNQNKLHQCRKKHAGVTTVSRWWLMVTVEIQLSADPLEDSLDWFRHSSTFHLPRCFRAQWIEQRTFYNLLPSHPSQLLLFPSSLEVIFLPGSCSSLCWNLTAIKAFC